MKFKIGDKVRLNPDSDKSGWTISLKDRFKITYVIGRLNMNHYELKQVPKINDISWHVNPDFLETHFVLATVNNWRSELK